MFIIQKTKERKVRKEKKKFCSPVLNKISTRAMRSSLPLSVSPRDNYCLPQRPDSHFVTDIPTLCKDIQKAVCPGTTPCAILVLYRYHSGIAQQSENSHFVQDNSRIVPILTLRRTYPQYMFLWKNKQHYLFNNYYQMSTLISVPLQ